MKAAAPTAAALATALASAGTALALPTAPSRRAAPTFACDTQRQKPLLLFPDGDEIGAKSINVTVVDGVLAANASLAHAQTYLFDKCPAAAYMGFSADYSRNAGGSMGAPLENWGHLRDASTGNCIKHNDDDTFSPSECSYSDDASQLQFWWRLQEGQRVAVDWFPSRNVSGHKYDGATPYSWLQPGADNSGVLRVTPTGSDPWGGILTVGTSFD